LEFNIESFRLRMAVSETLCVVLLPFVYSGCFMFIVVTSVLMWCWFGFLFFMQVL
jgi:hypothetical protein